MKRSKMLDIIMDVLDTDDGYPLAKNILDRIEKEGMLPPIEPDRTVYDLDLGVPEWEPEEGQK